MTTKPAITVTLLTLLLAACAPQAELVKLRSEINTLRNEVQLLKSRSGDEQKQVDKHVHQIQKRLDVLGADVKGSVDVQKVMADYGAKTDQITTDIQLLQGRVEENNYRIAEVGQKNDDHGVKLAELAARIEGLETKVKVLSSGTGTSSAGQAGTAGKPSSPTIGPSEAYRQAKRDYDKGNFQLALAGFQNFVSQFPKSSQADAAQYWAGECYYSMHQFNKAINAFQKVVKNYHKSDKAAAAKLKIGFSYLNEKNTAKAKEYLRRVVREHPDTNEARIAKDRLARIGK